MLTLPELGEIHRVRACAAVQVLITRAANKEIIASVAIERLGAVARNQRVIQGLTQENQIAAIRSFDVDDFRHGSRRYE